MKTSKVFLTKQADIGQHTRNFIKIFCIICLVLLCLYSLAGCSSSGGIATIPQLVNSADYSIEQKEMFQYLNNIMNPVIYEYRTLTTVIEEILESDEDIDAINQAIDAYVIPTWYNLYLASSRFLNNTDEYDNTQIEDIHWDFYYAIDSYESALGSFNNGTFEGKIVSIKELRKSYEKALAFEQNYVKALNKYIKKLKMEVL
jgi:hypothetical protein